MKRILFAHRKEWLRPVEQQLGAKYHTVFWNFRDPGLKLSDFDCVVPVRLPDYAPLRARGADHANFLIPSERVVTLADDKRDFIAFLHANNFGAFVPDVYDKDVRYPFIYKKRRDSAGANSQIIFSADERAAFERERTAELGDYYKQAYTQGRAEYTTHMLAVSGTLKFAATVEFHFAADHYVRAKSLPGKAVRKADTPFLDLFRGIVEALGYNGTCCINYKIEDGKPKIFELNPRCGGSLRLDLTPYIEAYLAALDDAARAGMKPPAVSDADAAARPAEQ